MPELIEGAYRETRDASDYGLGSGVVSVVVLPSNGRGRNARGLSAAKRGWGFGSIKGVKEPKEAPARRDDKDWRTR